MPSNPFQILQQNFRGEIHTDDLHRHIYATDASVYRELPLAVTVPKDEGDIQQLVLAANQNNWSLIPRAGGTSLAGQCVGAGVVVDVSKYMNQILELNVEEKWVRVQPGVIRDELNAYLKSHGLFFGPNTSTANRCMIGGMVGNNSCGSTSIVYGSTRDHTLELRCVLSDGSIVHFSELSQEAFDQKRRQADLEGHLYQAIHQLLDDEQARQEIADAFPKASIHRRNTGYALDLLAQTGPFQKGGPDFNFCQLLCGSEGTLALTTEIKLNLVPLPPAAESLICIHFNDLQTTLQAVPLIMQHHPSACELMDRVILDCTKSNIEQQKNRFFVEGDPAAILMVEFRSDQQTAADQQANQLIEQLRDKKLGYAFPVLHAPLTQRAWDLRKAGLGLLANIPGPAKAVACIEDTAVDVNELPAYIEEFTQLMSDFKQEAVYYAHAGAGELHLRPVLDLKRSEDVAHFRQITEATAHLVKKYRGSLSGEHGDGRVRAEFIPLMLGEQNYQRLRALKQSWDPHNRFNPGKIVDADPMDTSLRYTPDQPDPIYNTLLDFSAQGSMLTLAEKCNGSGDCRKLPLSGGTMCPSYQATRDEKDTTRARANTLREMMTQHPGPDVWQRPELSEVMDLCLSCKGCTSECPSNVDMSSLKAEYLYQRYKQNGASLRARMFARNAAYNERASHFSWLSRPLLGSRPGSWLLKKVLGIAPQRKLPLIGRISLRKWLSKRAEQTGSSPKKRGVLYLFIDEFTNLLDTKIGMDAVELLEMLGYDIRYAEHAESGRAALSKGLLEDAQLFANQNIERFAPLISEDCPLVGIEPSAILGFRDEYAKLATGENKKRIVELAPHCLTIEEFLWREVSVGRITKDDFFNCDQTVWLHVHCHQKALSEASITAFLLGIIPDLKVNMIPSGCCGMAGSFGYEKEHFEVSMKIGELVLFPAVRYAHEEDIIVAAGTSCRHQIEDGTGRGAIHPVSLLRRCLRSKHVN